MPGKWSSTWQNKAVIKSMVVIDSSVPGRVARFLPAWRKCMTMTIRLASTIVFIGLQETNTIGYYRVHVFPLTVPPLRERVDDIPVLVAYLIERYATKAGKKIRTIKKQTVELLQTYDWPGNIRELQNVIERAVILCESDTFAVEER